MKHLPFLLVYSRIVIALLTGILPWMGIGHLRMVLITLIALGLLTDIFDGIIARSIGVATQKLRVWDSNVDQLFWILVLIAVFTLHVGFFQQHYLLIVFIVWLEVVAYLYSYRKFKRTIATHTLLAKTWTLTLFAFLMDLIWHGQSNLLFNLCAVLGIISRMEIILIIHRLREWRTDVPSIFAVDQNNTH